MEATTSHAPLLHPPSARTPPLKAFAATLVSLILLLSLALLHHLPFPSPSPTLHPRGVAEGVSAKSNPSLLNHPPFNWTNDMLSWQRSTFHFQPQKNWMNGPLYHKGWYHLFYQYNPYSAIWSNITWGHAVSKYLIHWLHLPLAMVLDRCYDIYGVWTGSTTLLPDGQILMLYTGKTNESMQVQNLAYPSNLSDPLLLHWVKYLGNPVMVPPPGIKPDDFRDPTTIWLGPDGTWHLAMGSKFNSTTGISLFTEPQILRNTNCWMGFYMGYGHGIKHVLKASLDDTKVDHYVIGRYDPVTDKWIPDNPEEDVGIGLKVDYGRYYDSKTFFDHQKQRRVLWGWINENDTETADLQKGWTSLQTIPRTVLYDYKIGTNLLQWPVEELDIVAEFVIEPLVSSTSNEVFDCGDGTVDRSTYGPFGLLVIADASLSELTPVYFRPLRASDGTFNTYFCTDGTRSSKASDVFKQVYGGKVPVLKDENYNMRVLVDHSIVESFAQGGRTVIIRREFIQRKPSMGQRGSCSTMQVV
ncbi:hypothetical protein V6N13_125450 [Hibiscus sabdariffa]